MINSEINTSLNTIIRTVSGEMKMSEIKEEIKRSLSHPDFKKNMNVIWDVTKADARAASTNEILGVISYISENTHKRGDGYKIALVATTELNLVMSKMFETYADKLTISIQIFNVLSDAMQWIDE